MNARGVVTAIGAVLFAGAGFAAGAFVSAYETRSAFAEPWAKMTVEAEGGAGKPGHTRIIFKNPKLPLQAVEIFTTGENVPTQGHVTLREGDDLTVEYDDKARPSALVAADGNRARLEYEGDRTRVTFLGPDGSQLGEKRLVVPIQLTASTLSGASIRGATGSSSTLAKLENKAISLFGIAEAQAAEADDEQVTVTREIPLTLDVKSSEKAGTATIDATCAPYGCAPSKHDLTAPGSTDLSIAVTGSVKKSTLKAPAGGQVDAFQEEARGERKAATKVLPHVARVVGAVGITAMACKSLGFTSPLCVKELGADPGEAGGAISSILHDVVESDSSVIDPRANQLFYEEEARAVLDKATPVDVCVSREGFARVCATLQGRPFGATPMASESKTLELKRGIGGTLLGSFTMTQSDGADCKFSPSPKTSGALQLTFDNDKNTVSASMNASERGSRPNMGCSLGTANMSWSQTYTVTASQTFTKEQLQKGGKLPLALLGTMSGSGSYSFSNCRTGDGASAACPGGKGDGYSYGVTLTGSIDLDSHVGSGQIVVSNAPLTTQGTWHVPAEPKP